MKKPPLLEFLAGSRLKPTKVSSLLRVIRVITLITLLRNNTDILTPSFYAGWPVLPFAGSAE